MQIFFSVTEKGIRTRFQLRVIIKVGRLRRPWSRFTPALGMLSDTVPSDTTALFVQHRGSLVDYAARIVGSRVQAEDVVQEAWLRLRQVEEQSTVLEPVAYLYRVVRNLAIDTRRKLSREVLQGFSEQTALGVPDESPSADRTATARDELRLVLEALAALPERTQIAVRMNRIEGRTLQEVANRLDLSVTRTFTIIAEGVAHCDRWRARGAADRPK